MGGTDEPLVWYEGAATTDRRFLQADERGSVIAVSDSAGGSLAINRYDEYGIPAVGNAGRFQYTGQVWLPETGLYWYKARMYSPSLGRFMQTDPIGYGDGLNWYGYVGADPVNRTDPSGLSCTNGNGYCDPGHPEDDGPLIDVQARHSGLRSGEIVPVGTGSNTSGPDTPNTGPDGDEIVVNGAKPETPVQCTSPYICKPVSIPCNNPYICRVKPAPELPACDGIKVPFACKTEPREIDWCSIASSADKVGSVIGAIGLIRFFPHPIAKTGGTVVGAVGAAIKGTAAATAMVNKCK